MARETEKTLTYRIDPDDGEQADVYRGISEYPIARFIYHPTPGWELWWVDPGIVLSIVEIEQLGQIGDSLTKGETMMGYIINIKNKMTLREFISQLQHGFEPYMDMPLSFVDAIHDDCDECDIGGVVRMKIKLSDELELRIFYR